ncbi:MAG: hypothetical protein ACKO3H_00555 [Verrucomicrobiota bacterium]
MDAQGNGRDRWSPGRWLCLVGVLPGLVGCSGSPEVELRNDASQTVSNLVVSGTGFTERIGTVRAGEGRRFVVRPTGESGVRIDFEAGGRRVDSGSQGYIEPRGGSRIRAVIGTNLDVRISDSPSRY